MLDPAGVLRQRLAGDDSLLIGALARLLGAPEPSDGEAIVVPLAAGVSLSLFAPPAPLAALRAVSGPLVAEATLEGDGRVHGAAVVSPLAATLDTDRPEPLTLTLDGLALLPAADVSAIRRRSGLVLLGELLRTGLEWTGSREPALRPVLDALALGGSPLANPATLLDGPRRLARAARSGRYPAGLLRLFDAVRGLAAPGSPAGPLALPWGLRAAAAADGDDAVLTVDWAAPPAGANVELDGELALRIVPGSLVSPRLARHRAARTTSSGSTRSRSTLASTGAGRAPAASPPDGGWARGRDSARALRRRARRVRRSRPGGRPGGDPSARSGCRWRAIPTRSCPP